MLIEILSILLSRILYTFYGYEGVNLLFKVSPSRCIVAVLKHYGAKIGNNTRIQAPFGIHNADNNTPILINYDLGGLRYGNGDIGNYIPNWNSTKNVITYDKKSYY